MVLNLEKQEMTRYTRNDAKIGSAFSSFRVFESLAVATRPLQRGLFLSVGSGCHLGKAC
jgi:hypothetical protein